MIAINGLLSEEETLKNSLIPNDYELLDVYPNPFNPSTTIGFSINRYSLVKLKVISLLGKELEILNNEYMEPGTHYSSWNGSEYSSGIYFINLETNSFSSTQKIILSK